MELNFNSVEINPDAQRIGGVQDRQRQGVQGGQEQKASKWLLVLKSS